MNQGHDHDDEHRHDEHHDHHQHEHEQGEHSHRHGHGGHHHHHVDANTSDARLIWSIALNVLLSVAQIIGGAIAGSLSLVADAIHNLNDAAALVLALVARKIARRPADEIRTFGYRRTELIGALMSLTLLLGVGVYLIYEAVMRAFDPQPVQGWIVVILAGIAFVVDAATVLLTWAMAKGSLNVRAAFIHNLSDALASVGVMIAGTVIILFQWYWADLVATVAISLFIFYHGWGMMKQTIRILMDSVPEGIELDKVVAKMEAVEHVHDVHHVHFRQIDETHASLEAHVLVDVENLPHLETIKAALKQGLKDEFGIEHSTLEFETQDVEPHDDQVIVQD